MSYFIVWLAGFSAGIAVTLQALHYGWIGY